MENQEIKMNQSIERIAAALEKLAAAVGSSEPNIQRELSEYPTFDWKSIGAEIVSHDADGPTRVRKDGFIWIRRSPDNKFGPTIWFSRTDGKDDVGETNYLRLITFREWPDPDPLPGKVKAAMNRNGNQRPAAPRQPVQNQTQERPIQAARQTVQAGPVQEGGFISTKDYYDRAKANGVPTDQAAMIAKFAGVNFNGPTNKMNFKKAEPVLEFVSVALASTGLAFSAILDTIKRSGSVELAAQELGITPA